MKIQTGQSEPIAASPLTNRIGSAPTQPLAESSAQTPALPPTQPETAAINQETFNPTQNAQMLQLIHNQPEIRPAMLAKAQQMVADPAYPPTNIIANLAKLFINASN